MAALGNTAMTRNVASGGPAMKMTSSSSDSQANAVRNEPVPVSLADQRARTNAPRFGCAPPVANART